MPIKLERGRKYTLEEIQTECDREVEERLSKKVTRRKGEFPVPREMWEEKARAPEELQVKADEIFIASNILRQDPRSLKMWGKYESDMRKAMDTATAGEGAEWIPTGFSAEMLKAVKLALKVAALHRHITMPTNPFKFGAEAGQVTIYLTAESTSDTATKVTASTPGTTNVTFTASKLMGRVLCSVEQTEDSAVAMVPFIREKMVEALAEAADDVCINGDDSTTHQDADTHALGATNHLKAWKGHRKLALAGAKVDLATFNIANLRAIRAAMGKYGVNPGKLAWIAGVKVYNLMLGLDEVKTIDKYGPMATILQGELAKLDGIPVIVSEKIREDLNATGVQDGITETKTVLPLVYTPGFLIGDKREVKLQVLNELYAETDQVAVVGSERLDMQPAYDATTETIVGLGYNIA